MRSKWTHGILALIIGFMMYLLSFSQAYFDMQENILAVLLLYIVIFMIGFFFGNAFENDDIKEEKKNE